MKKLKFVALFLVATVSTLMYVGCDKRTGGRMDEVDNSHLQGGTWVYTKSIVDYFDDAGKLIYTETLKNPSRMRFNHQWVSILTTDENGFEDNKLYDFIRVAYDDTRRHRTIQFKTYGTSQYFLNVYLGTGSESNIRYEASTVDYTKLTSTDLTMISNQGQARVFTPKGTTTKIHAARSFLTIYYKKEKQIGD